MRDAILVRLEFFIKTKRWWAGVCRWFSKILVKRKMSVQTELDSARHLGEQLEELVVKRGQCPDEDRNILLIGYWALVFDFHKAILSLIPNNLCGSAFALVRPTMEALVRSHVAVKGSAEDVERLRNDDYRTNFTTIGPWIDTEFGAGDLFTNFLGHARTHFIASRTPVSPNYRGGLTVTISHRATTMTKSSK